MVFTGHCLCKAVTYSIYMDAPLLCGYDHCDDCQRQSGSTYCRFFPSGVVRRTRNEVHANAPIALVFVALKDKVTINGPTKSWAGVGSSGKAVHRIFCSECGSPIAHDPDAAPPIIAMKAGTLDTEYKKALKPVRSILLNCCTVVESVLYTNGY